MLSTRPSDDELFMRVAHEVATRSLCDRDQVGAVIVDTQLRITGTGRNGPPAGYPHQEQTCTMWCLRAIRGTKYAESDYSDCPSLHAEVNALLSSDRSRHEGGTIYITSDVCFSCAKMIANSGITTIVVETDPLTFMQRHAEATYAFLESLGVNVITVESKSEDG